MLGSPIQPGDTDQIKVTIVVVVEYIFYSDFQSLV